jgi:hypothetical protein
LLSISDSVMVEVIDKVISNLPKKERFYGELEKMQIKTADIPNNLYPFHKALKNAFGKDHYSIESLIIKTLHEDTKKEPTARMMLRQSLFVFLMYLQRNTKRK